MIDLATAAKRHSTRPGHVKRIEQHSLNLAVAQLREDMNRNARRQNAMLRIGGSLVGLLGSFAVAIGQQWMTWPMALTTLVGALSFVALFAEMKSDRT